MNPLDYLNTGNSGVLNSIANPQGPNALQGYGGLLQTIMMLHRMQGLPGMAGGVTNMQRAGQGRSLAQLVAPPSSGAGAGTGTTTATPQPSGAATAAAARPASPTPARWFMPPTGLAGPRWDGSWVGPGGQQYLDPSLSSDLGAPYMSHAADELARFRAAGGW